MERNYPYQTVIDPPAVDRRGEYTRKDLFREYAEAGKYDGYYGFDWMVQTVTEFITLAEKGKDADKIMELAFLLAVPETGKRHGVGKLRTLRERLEKFAKQPEASMGKKKQIEEMAERLNELHYRLESYQDGKANLVYIRRAAEEAGLYTPPRSTRIIRFLTFIVFGAMLGSFDVASDTWTCIMYWQGSYYMFAGFCTVLLVLQPVVTYMFLAANGGLTNPGIIDFLMQFFTLKLWQESIEAFQQGASTFGMAFMSLGETCLEAFPTSVIQQFSLLSGMFSASDGYDFGFMKLTKEDVVSISIATGFGLMAKTVYAFDFYADKGSGVLHKARIFTFRFGEVSSRTTLISLFWVLLRPENTDSHSNVAWHLPVFVFTSVVSTNVILCVCAPSSSAWGRLVWGILFLLASPPEFLTSFSAARTVLLIWHLIESTALGLLIYMRAENPMQRVQAFIWLPFLCVLGHVLVVCHVAYESIVRLCAQTSVALTDGDSGKPEVDIALHLAVENNDDLLAKMMATMSPMNVWVLEPVDSWHSSWGCCGRLPLYYAKSESMANYLASLMKNMQAEVILDFGDCHSDAAINGLAHQAMDKVCSSECPIEALYLNFTCCPVLKDAHIKSIAESLAKLKDAPLRRLEIKVKKTQITDLEPLGKALLALKQENLKDIHFDFQQSGVKSLNSIIEWLEHREALGLKFIGASACWQQGDHQPKIDIGYCADLPEDQKRKCYALDWRNVGGRLLVEY